MRSFIVLSMLLLLCTGCGTFQDLSENVGQARDLLDRFQDVTDDLIPAVDQAIESGQGVVDEAQKLVDLDVDVMEVIGPALEELKTVKEEYSTVKQEAFQQADQDGDGSLDWFERIGYIIFIVGSMLEVLRRKLKGLTGRIEHERSKRKALEGQVTNGHGHRPSDGS